MTQRVMQLIWSSLVCCFFCSLKFQSLNLVLDNRCSHFCCYIFHIHFHNFCMLKPHPYYVPILAPSVKVWIQLIYFHVSPLPPSFSLAENCFKRFGNTSALHRHKENWHLTWDIKLEERKQHNNKKVFHWKRKTLNINQHQTLHTAFVAKKVSRGNSLNRNSLKKSTESTNVKMFP